MSREQYQSFSANEFPTMWRIAASSAILFSTFVLMIFA